MSLESPTMGTQVGACAGLRRKAASGGIWGALTRSIVTCYHVYQIEGMDISRNPTDPDSLLILLIVQGLQAEAGAAKNAVAKPDN